MRDRIAKSAQNLNVTVDERIKCVNYGAIFSGKLQNKEAVSAGECLRCCQVREGGMANTVAGTRWEQPGMSRRAMAGVMIAF